MEELENQINKTKKVIKDCRINGRLILQDTHIILENQLVILEILKSFKNLIK